jgi:hypothetical protein
LDLAASRNVDAVLSESEAGREVLFRRVDPIRLPFPFDRRWWGALFTAVGITGDCEKGHRKQKDQTRDTVSHRNAPEAGGGAA